jgi:Cu/Ag efflux protein CusF
MKSASLSVHLPAASLVLMLAVSPAWAQSAADLHHHHATLPATAAAQNPVAQAVSPNDWAHGEVTRWDARTGKLTIRHGEIRNLAMPPMTMVFALQDPAQGAALQAGAKVRFRAESLRGALVITHIEPQS